MHGRRLHVHRLHVESLTIDCPNADNVKVKTSNAKDMTTGAAYTALFHATGPSVFTFAHGGLLRGADGSDCDGARFGGDPGRVDQVRSITIKVLN